MARAPRDDGSCELHRAKAAVQVLKIKNILLAPGTGAFFYDDQAAILSAAHQDCFGYSGAPLTLGFTAIRLPAASLGIGLVLPDDTVAWGDMMSVQYSAAAGRDPLFERQKSAAFVRSAIPPRLLPR